MDGAFQIDADRWWILDANIRSTSEGRGTAEKRASGTEMFDDDIARRVGTRIHRVIAAAVHDGLPAGQVGKLVEQWWKEAPLGGTTAWQTRNRAALAAAVYLRLLRPIGWDLIGYEIVLDGAVADLVYSRSVGGAVVEVFIDEVKTGTRVFDQPELADQVHRLEQGGTARWGAAFRGVRVSDLSRASKVGFWTSDGRTLTRSNGPVLECGERTA